MLCVTQLNFECELNYSCHQAHFDGLPKEFSTVDGAKIHWCNLLLLDAMIFILKNHGFTHTTRRAFNQHQVLYDCIMNEFAIMDKSAHELLSNEKEYLIDASDNHKEMADKYSNMYVYLLDDTWQSMEALETHLLSHDCAVPQLELAGRFHHSAAAKVGNGQDVVDDDGEAILRGHHLDSCGHYSGCEAHR